MGLTLPSSLQNEVKFPSSLSAIVCNILTGLLTKDPARRLGGSPKDAQDVKGHDLFATLNWQVS